MLKYYVRTTGERVLDESYNQIKYELLIDKEHKPVESFIDQLSIISEDDAVLMEDDLILCNDFKSLIENVIKQYPNKIINFFTKPNEYFTTHESQSFAFNQCTYYPKGIGKKLSKKMKAIREYNPNIQYDTLEYRAMLELRILNLKYRPCLVQHLDMGSLIQSHSLGMRTSPYFIDYFKYLGINYEEAYEYVRELKEIMKLELKNRRNKNE
ncbi:MAG: hypothetical protein K6G28_05650 [Acholeplasmatales bacterium]|nr:hypothetical protein [Acholeplasmatales bacterium]